MELDEMKAKAAALSPWAHMATVGSDGNPDVVPVHPCWGAPAGAADGDDDVIWIMAGETSVKAHNIAVNPNVALHWQVTEKGDGVEMWGTATMHTDLETKHRLWNGVFDYDLNLFAPGGPDDSAGTAFIAVRPDRALWLDTYGMGGTARWSR